MCQKPILRLSSFVLTALLFTGNAAGEEVGLPHKGITLNGNLVLAPGNTLSVWRNRDYPWDPGPQ